VRAMARAQKSDLLAALAIAPRLPNRCDRFAELVGHVNELKKHLWC